MTDDDRDDDEDDEDVLQVVALDLLPHTVKATCEGLIDAVKSAPHVHPIRVRVDLSSLHPAQLRHVRTPRSTARPMLAASARRARWKALTGAGSKPTRLQGQARPDRCGPDRADKSGYIVRPMPAPASPRAPSPMPGGPAPRLRSGSSNTRCRPTPAAPTPRPFASSRLDDASLAAHLGHLHQTGRATTTAVMAVARPDRAGRSLRFIAGRILRELIGVLTLSMMVLPGVAVAQDMAVSLDELLRSGSLRPGEGVYVTDAAGRRLKGTISDVSSTELMVTHRGQAWTVAGADVRKIDLQDSLANGIGYGMVAVAGPISAACGASGGHPGECAYVLLYAFPVVAIGGVVGGIVDALRHKTIYRAAGSVKASVSPIVSHGSLGTQVSVAW